MPSLLSIGCDEKIINSLSSVDPPIRTVEGFLERNIESLSLESGLSSDVLILYCLNNITKIVITSSEILFDRKIQCESYKWSQIFIKS